MARIEPGFITSPIPVIRENIGPIVKVISTTLFSQAPTPSEKSRGGTRFDLS